MNSLTSQVRRILKSVQKPFFYWSRANTKAGSVLAIRDNALLKIGNGVFINRNTIITSRKSIILEDGVTIGSNVCIYDHDIYNRGGYMLDNLFIKKKHGLVRG